MGMRKHKFCSGPLAYNLAYNVDVRIIYSSRNPVSFYNFYCTSRHNNTMNDDKSA